MHDVPAERGDRRRAAGAAPGGNRPTGRASGTAAGIAAARASAVVPSRRRLRSGRRLYDAAAIPPRGIARPDLPGALARQRARCTSR
jgi:hypothetical protein